MSDANESIPVLRFPPARSTPTSLADASRRLAVCLERGIGWTPTNLEIDLGRGTLVVELHRFDGRWVRLDVRDGRVVLDRFQRFRRIGPRTRSWEAADEDEFLGRQTAGHFGSTVGPRAALRLLCDYLADNPAPGFRALPVGEVRDLFRPLLGAAESAEPKRLEG